MLRAVHDTNVVLAAHRTNHPSSPNREVIERWLRGEYTLLYTDDMLAEFAEKMLTHAVPRADILRLLASIRRLGEKVFIAAFHVRPYPADEDDIAFLLCAINGAASHLVSYDDDLLSLHDAYLSEFIICQPITFLADLRKQAKP